MKSDPPVLGSSDASAGDPRGARSWWRQAPATILLGGATIVFSATLWVLAGQSDQLGDQLRLWLWNDPWLVTRRLWLWQVVTANFVHSGLVHLGINVFLLVWLGPRLENDLGSLRFAGFYMAAGVFANGLYDLWPGVAHARLTTGGASASVLAVATLYALCFPRRIVHLYGFIRVPFWVILLLFVVSDVSAFLWPSGAPWANNIAHLAGVAFAVAYWSLWARRRVRPERVAD